MTPPTIDLKEEVRKALGAEWPAFAATHPKLAAALDETVLLDPAMQSLADDPEYQETMRTADAVGAGAQIVSDVVSRFVRQWLRTLV
jgi:hypothetical protein